MSLAFGSRLRFVGTERMATLTIHYPDDRLSEWELSALEALAREALLVRLYALGRISSGRGAEVLGISRSAFLDLLSAYGISHFDDQIDFDTEVGRGL